MYDTLVILSVLSIGTVRNIGLVEMDVIVGVAGVGDGWSKGCDGVSFVVVLVVAEVEEDTLGEEDDNDNNMESFVSITHVPIRCNVLLYCSTVSSQPKSPLLLPQLLLLLLLSLDGRCCCCNRSS